MSIPILGQKPQEPPRVQLLVAPHQAGVVVQIIRDGLDVHNAPLDLQGAANVMMQIGAAIETAAPGTLIPALIQWIGAIERQREQSAAAIEVLSGR